VCVCCTPGPRLTLFTQGGGNDGGFTTFGGSQQSPAGADGGARVGVCIGVFFARFFVNAQDQPSAQQRKDFVTSVTAHQIRQASKGSDDSFRIDGKDVHHVVIMGVVRTFEQRETKFTCTVEDHTGARAGAGPGRGQLRDSPSANHR
jgi:hypothetical protein